MNFFVEIMKSIVCFGVALGFVAALIGMIYFFATINERRERRKWKRWMKENPRPPIREEKPE